METKGVAILTFKHWDSKTNQQTYVGTKKWDPFEGPLSSLKKNH
jgi:hypothetical protein